MAKPKLFLGLYLFLTLLHLAGVVLVNETLIFGTKPLLMPVLALWFWTNSKKEVKSIRFGIILALFFSTFGDVFLMFEEHAPWAISLFVPGLVSFLLTHLLYMFVFVKIAKGEMGYLYKHPWVIIPFAIFLSGILYYLWPDLPSGLNIAVAIYSSCIVAMALLSINTKPHLLPTAFIMLLIGALSFVFSDTVIALNKFKTAQLSISHARLIIMFFYLLGQGLIVGSLVVNSTSSSHISSDYQQS